MNSNQIAAAKALIDKAVPTLSAVETTQLEAAAVSTEAEILEQLTALVRANPSLMSQIQGEVARQANSVVNIPHVAIPNDLNQNNNSVAKKQHLGLLDQLDTVVSASPKAA
jgi:hypothetical protein